MASSSGGACSDSAEGCATASAFSGTSSGLAFSSVTASSFPSGLSYSTTLSPATRAAHAQLHGLAHLDHGLLGAGAGAIRTVLKNLFHLRIGEAGTALLDGLKELDECVRRPAL